MIEDKCSLGDGRPRYSRGWCSMHYMRWYTHGDPLTTHRILGDDRARFESKVDRSSGPDACHPWLGAVIPSTGYGYFWRNGKMHHAHIIAWEFANDGRVPKGKEVDHECHNRAVQEGTCKHGRCDHRLCCNSRHLTPKTRQEHVDDTGPFAHVHGCENGRAKLTEQQVIDIRAALAAGATAGGLAKRYGLGSATTIRAIRDRKTWAWLDA